jgi:ABC-type maltose transport system permease subunit
VRNAVELDEPDFRQMGATSLVDVVPVLIVFSLVQLFLVSGLTSGAVKGRVVTYFLTVWLSINSPARL